MTKNNCLIKTSLLGALLAFQAPAQAQTAPEISPSLKSLLGGLPIAGIKDELQRMLVAVRKTPCGKTLPGCYGTQSGPLQLYFYTGASAQQTLLLVVDQRMALPRLLSEKVQRVMGETSISAPIISLSTADFALDTVKMPPALRQVVSEHYFNVKSLEFSSGVQIAARADLGGPIKLAMESLGVKGDQLTLRAAVVMPIPLDLVGGAQAGAGAAAGAADAMAHGATMSKAGADAAKPEAFVEFQFAPGAKLPMLMPRMDLSDATFFLNNSLTLGYKGNATFPGVGDKKFILHFQTPLNIAGALDLLDFQFRVATPPSFTLEDGVHMLVAMVSPDPRLAAYGGGFVRDIAAYKQALLAAVRPLGVIQVRNPKPPAEYRFGDSTRAFPTDPAVFNISVLGPLVKDGPWLGMAGEAFVLGEKLGHMQAAQGLLGLYGAAGADIDLKLGPLGKVKMRMDAHAAIDRSTQSIGLTGNYMGQAIDVQVRSTTVRIDVSPSCVNPFEIRTTLDLKATTSLAGMFDAQGGANVDPKSIGGCIGKELEAAYKKIAGDYKNLSGYTASAASAELKKISDAAKLAEQQARQAQQAAEEAAATARRDYEAAKDTARDVASKTSNAATQAFNDAGNAFKRLGKKKHKKGPDPKFAASVFDWDYYYDNRQEVVRQKLDLATHWRDTGFKDGRQGSPEFSTAYYWQRYLDVQQLCGRTDRDCILKHWLDNGIEVGRQGSSGFSVASYLNRHADLQTLYGEENYADALVHWLTDGEEQGRDGRPQLAADGPVSGPVAIGGDGGGAWSDRRTCLGQYVTGFRLAHGRTVDRVQFRYAGDRWAPPQGSGAAFNAEVKLADGEYIVRVDYRSGSLVDGLSFRTNTGKTFGPYGGTGGTAGRYDVTPGEKLGCMRGRSGGSTDQLTFSSTGLR